MGTWRDVLDDRQKRIVDNCIAYASGDPAGLPGHQLMLVVATMAALLDGIELVGIVSIEAGVEQVKKQMERDIDLLTFQR